jgi:hypothetical protein
VGVSIAALFKDCNRIEYVRFSIFSPQVFGLYLKLLCVHNVHAVNEDPHCAGPVRVESRSSGKVYTYLSTARVKYRYCTTTKNKCQLRMLGV